MAESTCISQWHAENADWAKNVRYGKSQDHTILFG